MIRRTHFEAIITIFLVTIIHFYFYILDELYHTRQVSWFLIADCRQFQLTFKSLCNNVFSEFGHYISESYFHVNFIKVKTF